MSPSLPISLAMWVSTPPSPAANWSSVECAVKCAIGSVPGWTGGTCPGGGA